MTANNSAIRRGLIALAVLAGGLGSTQVAEAQFQRSAFVGAAPNAGNDNTAYGNWLNAPDLWASDNMAYIEGNWQNIANPTWQLPSWTAWKNARAGRKLMLAVPMLQNDGGTIAMGNLGMYDTYFSSLADKLVAANLGDSILRLGWEFNGNWFPWKASVDPAGWINYYRRIVGIMRNRPNAGNLKFCWNPNYGTQSIAPSSCYPGGGYVDYIGMDLYDVDWHYTLHQSSNATQRADAWSDYVNDTFGLNWLRSFSLSEGKPIIFCEWGVWDVNTKTGGGDNPDFIQSMYNWMSTPGNNVALETYFDYDWTDGQHRLWPGANGSFVSQFPNAKAKYLQLFGGTVSGGGSLSGSVVNASTSTSYNLSTLGTADWAHWGSAGYVHKSGITAQIGNVTQQGGTFGNTTNATRGATWTGGTPTASGTNDHSYYWCNGTSGQGWSFTVPASSTSRTLNVYWGGAPYAGVKIKLVAHLNDNSAPDYVSQITNTASVYSYVTTLTYSAPTNTTLKVTLTKDDAASNTSVDLKGAWLTTSGGGGGGNTHSGSWAGKAVVTTTPGWTKLIHYDTNVSTGTNYTGSIWVKGSGKLRLDVLNSDWSANLASVTLTATGSWQQVSLPTFSSGSNTKVHYIVYDAVGGTAGTVYFDDCFFGTPGGSNLLTNPGFESGATDWITAGVFSIVQNP